MKNFDYPHAIENGGGEKLTFLRRVRDENGERVEVENEVQPGKGPPMHVHFRQAEGLTVQQGRIGYQRLGEAPAFAGVGDTVVFKAGEPHRFWNAGDEVLRCVGWISPPDNVEYFLTQMFASTKASGGERPHPLDAAFLMGRYGKEFDMLELPGFVKRVVMPVARVVGRLTGHHRKFADAPSPIVG